MNNFYDSYSVVTKQTIFSTTEQKEKTEQEIKDEKEREEAEKKAEDEKAREAFAAERERIIQKMEVAKNNGVSTRKPQPKTPHHFHCNSMDETSKGIFIKE